VARPLQEEDFAEVGAFLITPPSEIELQDWAECEEARSRSAISRSYYAVFLSLKSKLSRARRSWTFPHNDVHRKLHQALLAELGAQHQLVIGIRSLLRDRKRADYDLRAHFDETASDSVLSLGWDCLDEAENLSQAELARIANRLYDIEQGL
jgi:hypothetical protein